jgi:beta-galactosidase
MSVLCDPRHPALALFPTDSHSDWQWHDILQRSRSMILDDLPKGYRPVVQVVDTFCRNHLLGNLIEARVGAGRLMVCSMDLRTDIDRRPVAMQMLRSVLAYMESSRFRPTQLLSAQDVAKLVNPPSLLGRMMREPGPEERAVLDVRAATNVQAPNRAEAWRPEADSVLVREAGFGYAVDGGTWRDSVGSAWHAASELRVTVTCPKSFTGTLFAHFHDWNELDRVAEITFQDRLLGTLREYGGSGKWCAIPVTAADSEGGTLVLSAKPSSVNAMITRIVLAR